MQGKISRREFLRVGGVGFAGVAFLGLAGCESGGETTASGKISSLRVAIAQDVGPPHILHPLTLTSMP